MTRYFLQRLLGLLPTLLIVAVLVFLFVHMLPGDPARLAAGPNADPKTVALVRSDLGLDRPMTEQFISFFTRMLHGDFGLSLSSRRPVSTEIADRFMPTLLLTLTSMAWSMLFGLAIGIVSAVFRNEWPDRLGMALAVSGISFPAFALGTCAYDSKDRQRVIDFDVTVEIDGVRFRPGELVMADEDGVVVVPQEAETEAIQKAWQKVHAENEVRDAIRGGVSATEVFRRYGIL